TEEQKSVIFDRFRQGNESLKRNFEGSGLGLSISKAFVEMLGGRIWVVDNEDQIGSAPGAKFLFTIPIKPSNEKEQFMQDASEEMPVKHLTAKLKILIAEDDKFSEMLFVKLVEGYTKEIITLHSGIDAIIACQRNP